MARGAKKQNRMAKLSITCMVLMLIGMMSTQIIKLYQKNEELALREKTYEEQKQEELARQQELAELEKTMQSQEYIEQEAHRYGLFYEDEIIFRERK